MEVSFQFHAPASLPPGKDPLVFDIGLGAFAASELDKVFSGYQPFPDNDDRDGHRNVGILRTPNAADSPRRLYQIPWYSFDSRLDWSWSRSGCGHEEKKSLPLSGIKPRSSSP
jgi:hypothetical protein